LNTYHVNLTVVDPWAEPAEVKHEYHLTTQKELPTNTKFDAVVLAVGHNEFKEIDIHSYLNPKHVIFDVKGLLDRNIVDGSL
jgi:UDP-N-acetyl-D-galactosamine dehydrogenase